jgi:hypothetical protein
MPAILRRRSVIPLAHPPFPLGEWQLRAAAAELAVGAAKVLATGFALLAQTGTASGQLRA